MKGMLRAAALAVMLCVGLSGTAAANDPLIYAVQEALADEGYNPGHADGVIGPRTQAAIRAFEAEYGLPVTGMLTHGLIGSLGLTAYASELEGAGGVRVVAAPGTEGPRKLAPLRLIPPVVSVNASVDTEAPPKAQPPAATEEKAAAVAEQKAATPSAIPPVEARFAPRNWLVSDLTGEGLAAAASFGVFLEEGGKVAGPRFANRLRWEADGARFSMVYRNGIGQEIRRTGKLNGLNRLEGEAVGPDGKTWRWVAEAKPL